MSSTLYHVIANDIPVTSITDKCIVIDLDHTLVSTQDPFGSLKELGILSNPDLIALRNRIYHIEIEDLEKPGVGTKYDFWGIIRPHVEEFLIFCFSYFRVVAVWSAGKRPYVEAIVDHLFRDLPKPHVVFSADDCYVNQAGNMEKPLTNMIESNPVLRRYMSLQNTFALDDTVGTFVHNTTNAILLPAYDPAQSVNAMSRDDPTLLQLKYWLLQPEVVNARDVTRIDTSTIFSVPLEVYKNRLQSLPGYRFN